MPPLLVVTNDFPPRKGGIQTFVHEIVRRLPPGDVTVLTSRWQGWEEFDAEQPYRVVRRDTSVMVPSPGTRSDAVALLRETGARTVLFGALAPLGLLAPSLREAGATRLVGLTHGHEAGWAGLPVMASLVRRAVHGVDAVTYLGSYTRDRIAKRLAPEEARKLVRLAPGVDLQRFGPDVDGSEVRRRYGLEGRPVIVCVSRLMARKGQDTLIRALPLVRREVPDAALLVVGGGPYRERLERLVAERGLQRHVVLTGAVPGNELPAHFAAGDVFAMPCRTRNHGLDVEGLGIVYLEASATGLPVVAGRSGGAPDAVQEGVTGYVVDGQDRLVEVLVPLLRDGDLRARLGAAGRAWVDADWSWDAVAAKARALLEPQPA